MKRLIVGLFMLACVGCAHVVTKVDLPDAPKSDSLSVSDVRPVNEKEKKFFSLLITSKEYGIVRTGDANLSPPPIRVLQYEAFQKFGGTNHKVTVYHFVIYQNLKSQLRKGAVGADIGGVLGAVIVNSMGGRDPSFQQTQIIDESTLDSVSGADEYQRGFYTSAENPDKDSVFIIYLDTDIDGKRVATRTIASMRKHGDESPLVAAVELAVKNHLGDYANSAVTASATSSAILAVTSGVSPRPTPVADMSSTPATPPPAVAAASPQANSADVAMASKAQNVANQLGCGAVQGNGNSTYVAPCGDHGVLIACDGYECRPMHTVSMKGNE